MYQPNYEQKSSCSTSDASRPSSCPPAVPGTPDNSRWINCQLQPALDVFLHIGENDIRHMDANAKVDHLWAQIQYIRAVAEPRLITVSQLVWFAAYEELKHQITWVNHHLQMLVEQSDPVPADPPTELQFLRHQYGTWGVNRRSLFADDNVRLNSGSLRKYAFRLRNATESHLRKMRGC